MGKRAEKRIETKLKILAAFERLCETSTYTKITVTGICQEAGISKPTFYRHFQSKDNIIRWMAKQTLKNGIIQIGRAYTWYEGYLRTFSIEHRHRVFYSDQQSPELIAFLQESGEAYHRAEMIKTITEMRNAELTDDLVFQIDSLLVVEGIMSRRWGASGMEDVTPQQMAKRMTSVVPHDLFELLNTPIEKPQVDYADPL